MPLLVMNGAGSQAHTLLLSSVDTIDWPESYGTTSYKETLGC